MPSAPNARSLRGWLRRALPTRAGLVAAFRPGSGPIVARTFHRLLALLFLIAFVSLGRQLELLIGSDGLAPAIDELRAQGADPSFWRFPTLFSWFGADDGALRSGIWAGALLSIAALAGVWPRACFAILTIIYMSFVTLAGGFLAFQWDNLLLECGVMAVFLPRRHAGRFVHILFLILLFKLYFESGIAKWQSHLRDWHDGSAMTHYYETAPIPSALAWWAHHLPRGWHVFESYCVLALELVVPFFAFGPRALRLVAFVTLTGFQIVNLATANYGFFVYLALALHVFLLEDRDLERIWSLLRRKILGRTSPWPPPILKARPWRAALAFAFGASWAAIYLPVSLGKALQQFARPSPLGPESEKAFSEVQRQFTGARETGWSRGVFGVEEYEALTRWLARTRVINNYHLFGHITRDRPEPEFQILKEGEWRAMHLHYKPGPLDRAPPLVAPHQPRVDFLLWFYGLGRGGGAPQWVRRLVDHLCQKPRIVQRLFVDRIPDGVEAVRIAFWKYQFTSPEERDATGHYWKRAPIGATQARQCLGVGKP